MAITFRKNGSRETLYAIAVENGVNVAEDADRTTIIAALDAHNAAQGAQDGAEGAGASDGTNDTPDGEQPTQGAQDGTEGAGASDGTNDTPDSEQPTQGAQDGAENMSEYTMFIYAGPSLPNGRLKENAVFRGKIEDVKNYLADVLEDYPQVARLIVPTCKIAAFSVKVKTAGNVANKYYNDIVSTMRNHKEV